MPFQDQLNRGETESKTLVEALAVDFDQLLAHLLPDTGHPPIPKVGIVKRMAYMGGYLQNTIPLSELTTHPSDTVRAWGAYQIGESNRDLESALCAIAPLADDGHFMVREWAWLALRKKLAAELEIGLKLLESWAQRPLANIRRFASEITRPRGVWTPHLRELKENPKKGIVLLKHLQNDPSRYVQNSVANWLNDAGKEYPEWVFELTERWLFESNTPETRYIVKRARRSLVL